MTKTFELDHSKFKKKTWYFSNSKNAVKNNKEILRTTTLIDQQTHLLRPTDRASPRLYRDGVKLFLGEHAKLTRRKSSPAVTVSALTRSMHRNRFIDEFEAWSKGGGPGPGQTPLPGHRGYLKFMNSVISITN